MIQPTIKDLMDKFNRDLANGDQRYMDNKDKLRKMNPKTSKIFNGEVIVKSTGEFDYSA